MADTTLLIEDQNHRTPKYFLASMSAWIGSFSLGTVLGYSSPALTSFKQTGSHIHIDGILNCFFASIMPFGAIIGCICAGVFNESVGRKGTLIFSSIPFLFGWISIAYSGNLDSVVTLLIGRFLTGLCCGLISLTAPVYIAETSDPAKRGFFGSGFQLTVTLGIVVTYVIGKYLNWADLALALTGFPLLFLFTILFMPESPAWLLRKGRISEATEANLFLHGAEGSRRVAVDVSIPTMQNSNEAFYSTGLSTWQQFKLFGQLKYRKPLLITIALMFFQQFSGVNAMIFFMTPIFENANFKNLSPSDSSIIVGFIQVLATLMACLFSDKFGRRVLLIVSSIGTHLGLIPMVIYCYMNERHTIPNFNIDYGWVPIVSLVIFIVFFSFGLGPVPWVIMGELLPFQVKNISSIIAASFNWFCAFLIITFYNNLADVVSGGTIYLVFSVICLICAVFNAFYLPETKGKSFQEIELLFTPIDTPVVAQE